MNLDKIRHSLKHDELSLPILGIEDYRRTAVIIPLFKWKDQWHILFEERAKHIAQGGEICFPGGMMESRDEGKGENCAVRETCEELGLVPAQVEILGALGREPGMKGLLVDVFVAELKISQLDELTPNEEVASVFSYPLDYFRGNLPDVYQVAVHISHMVKDKDGKEQSLMPVEKLRLPKRYHEPWGHRLHDVYFYDTEKAMIWGLTARILSYFIRSLED